MSSIEGVRTAEKRVKKFWMLPRRQVPDPNNLAFVLKNATDKYARVVRELNSKWPLVPD